MQKPVIEVENLSKCYRLHERQLAGPPVAAGRDRTLAASVAQRIAASLRRGSRAQNGQVLWALRDVSFTVARGEALGIVGGNGAGKSTLLKIISRLTAPTTGRVVVRGRVGSMLELGVGFNPELTGRENVHLSGVLLGLRRSDIRRRFGDIVAFSGIEEFIDVPVKRYSSGMRLRLAFSVMATLEPEVLLLDEIMGVGDADFRQRSNDRLREMLTGGASVLLVSHQPRVIEEFCDRAVLLEKGCVRFTGPPEGLPSAKKPPPPVPAPPKPPPADKKPAAPAPSDVAPPKPVKPPPPPPPPPRIFGRAELAPRPESVMCLREVCILNADGAVASEIELSEPFEVLLRYDINEEVVAVHVFCRIETLEGLTVLGTGDADCEPSRFRRRRRTGSYVGRFRVPGSLLEGGQYRLTVSMGEPGVSVVDRHPAVVHFNIVDRLSRRQEFYKMTRPGVIGCELAWNYDGAQPWCENEAQHANH